MPETQHDNQVRDRRAGCNPQALDPDEWSRHAGQTAALFERIDTIEPLADGYRFRIPAEAEALQAATRFVARERHCCPSFRFELSLDAGTDHAWLAIRGGSAIRDQLARDMIPLIRAARSDEHGCFRAPPENDQNRRWRIETDMRAESTKAHWENNYASRPHERLGWYAPHLATSLDWIVDASEPGDAIVDAGGGASTLVDDLLAAGRGPISVVDLSPTAMDTARQRLGERARSVEWLAGDIAGVDLPRHGFRVWHDRAVFHFLVDADQRARYRRQLDHALAPGGWLVIGTFAPDGPEQCSGLPVRRYSADSLQAEFGPDFELERSRRETHVTPAGREQQYVYCRLRRID